MTYFPTDMHTCEFSIFINSYSSSQVAMTTNDTNAVIMTTLWQSDGEWQLVRHSVYKDSTYLLGMFKDSFNLVLTFQRLPTFFMLNLLCPTMALSFLNILVFVLPVESGEKVGYSITVLLSVMVFMTETMHLLPSSSISVPLVTQFLTMLTAISILSVVATVFSSVVHHQSVDKEEEEKMNPKVLSRMASSSVDQMTSQGQNKGQSIELKSNRGHDRWSSEKYRCVKKSVIKHLNITFLCIFLFAWSLTTLVFIVTIFS